MRELFESIPTDLHISREFFIAISLIGALFTGLAGEWLWMWGFVMGFLAVINASGRTCRDELDEQG